MATQTKTIEFPFTQSDTSTGTNTRLDFSAISVYIPENAVTPVTFKSVSIEYTRLTDGATVTAWLIGIKLGASAFDDETITAEMLSAVVTPQSALLTRITGLVSYFQTNFGGGSSQTCQVGVRTTGATTRFHAAKIIITYEYDDSATTQIKTIWIPLESQTGKLSNVLTELGTSQVPQLTSGGLIKEASPVIRDLWFEIETNEGEETGGSSAYMMGLQIDSASEALEGSNHQGNTLQCHSFYRRIWRQTSLDPTATHTFKARATVTNRFTCLAIIMCVTYEYNEAASTQITNSLQIIMPCDSGLNGGSTSGDGSRSSMTFQIQELGTITLLQSGIKAYCYDMPVLAMKAGAQTERTYTLKPDTTEAISGVRGTIPFTHRVDSGAAQGAGMTLARGDNTLTLDWYRSETGAAQIGSEPHIIAYVNYASDKASSGSAAHNRTMIWNVAGQAVWDNTGTAEIAAIAPVIQPSLYWLTACGAQLNGQVVHPVKADGSDDTTALQSLAPILKCQRATGEGSGAGWQKLTAQMKHSTVDRIAVFFVGDDITPYLNRNPSDPNEKMDLEVARKYRIEGDRQNLFYAARLLVTCHALTRTYAGNVYMYDGNGSGLTVTLHDTFTGEKLGVTTTSVGGAFTLTTFNNTAEMYVEVQQDSGRVGRSANAFSV